MNFTFKLHFLELFLVEEEASIITRCFGGLALFIIVVKARFFYRRLFLFLKIIRFIAEELPNLFSVFDFSAAKILYLERGLWDVFQRLKRVFPNLLSLHDPKALADFVGHTSQR